jgi:hypothetical protein
MAENQYMQPFFDSLSQGVQVAQGLRQAALQQQELDLQKNRQADEASFRQQELDRQGRESGLRENLDRATLLQQGAKPVDAQGNVPTPTPAPLNDMNAEPGQRFTLNGTASTPLPTDPGRTMSIGGSPLQVPGIQDMLDQDLVRRKAESGIGKVPLTKEGSDMIGGMFPEGTPVSPEHMPGLAAVARANAINNKEPKPRALQHTGFTTDGRPLSFDPESGKTTAGDRIPGMENQGGAGADKTLTPDAMLNARLKSLSDYKGASKEEADLEGERLALGTALRTGQHYIDAKGALKKFDAGATDEEKSAMQDNMRQMFQAKTNRLKQVIADKNDAMGRYGTTPQVSNDKAFAAIDHGTQQVLGTPAATPPPAAQVPAKGTAPATQTADARTAAPKAVATPTVKVGTIAVNKATKERRQWDGTKWAPLPTQ